MSSGAKGVGTHAGARLLGEVADGLGLTVELLIAMAPKQRRRGHCRGEVLIDLAVG